MNKRSRLSAVGHFFGVLDSAAAVSRAVESRRAPKARDLEALGIDPAQFNTIRQF